MHRNYPEWEEASYKTWGPITIKQAVEDISELIDKNAMLRRKHSAAIYIAGHELIGSPYAIQQVSQWERKASTFDEIVTELRRRVKELEDGSRILELQNKIVDLTNNLAEVRRQVRLEGELP